MTAPAFTPIVLAALVAGIAPAAFGQGRGVPDHEAALEARRAGLILPLAELRRRVARQLPGRIVGHRLLRTNRGWVYELRLISARGRVLYSLVEADTGRVRLTHPKKDDR
ncbi:PepSY domain-containing protein [Yunchengibacter salinarum]|uniref:PepSY domain-containing protein n=1 Tax=Yunchengibacter salinarum TaxID=3133399 RepID=UPI0035B5D324